MTDDQIVELIYDDFMRIDGGYACDTDPDRVAAAIRKVIAVKDAEIARIVQALEGEIARLDRESQNLSDQLGRCDRERRELRAQLALQPAAVPVGWKLVPTDADDAMVAALKARLAVTHRGGILNAGNALNDAISAAPAAPQQGLEVGIELLERVAKPGYTEVAKRELRAVLERLSRSDS